MHRLPLPLPMDGLRAVNVYVIETDDGLVLIDGGWAIPESRKVFDAGLKQLGYTVRDIRRFLVTHMHRDHYTQASVVGREVGAHVAPRPRRQGDDGPDAQRRPQRGPQPGPAALRRRRGAGRRMAGDDAGRSAVDGRLRHARRVARPRPRHRHRHRAGSTRLSTPGHTQGHYVFADGDASLLFAGDHVLSTITPSIGFEPAYVQQPLRDYLASLAKVRALPDMKLLPAHGPVTASSHTRVDELVALHDVRLERSLRRGRVRRRARRWRWPRELPVDPSRAAPATS